MNQTSLSNEMTFPALTLFITGDAPRSQRARQNLSAALHVLGLDSLKPMEVDLLARPEESITYSVFATPALLRVNQQGGVSIIYGDLSDQEKVLDFLKGLSE